MALAGLIVQFPKISEIKNSSMVFTKFVNDLQSEGLHTEVRYSPFAGLRPIPDTKPKQQVIVPGDPTTKVNVAELLNTAAHR